VVNSQIEDESQRIEKISKQDLHLETTARLARLISASEPGSRLPTERELCEQLGVGRSTLREAIRSLSFVGAIQARQGSGTYVSRPEDSAAEKLIGLGLTLQRARVWEVIEARTAIEKEAVRIAAQRYTEADRAALLNIMGQLEASRDDLSKSSSYDLQFHLALTRASQNSVLVHLINGMQTLLEIWMKHAINRDVVVEQVVGEHNAVLEAVFARDADRAAAMMDAHLTRAAERLFSALGRDESMEEYLSLLLMPEA
jgi:GntR family transcriptional repressor for pyruvate dehydrogenase complex